MRYVYLGPYTEFRGHVFMNGKPVEITDRGTLEAIAKRTDFKAYVEPIPPVASKRPILTARRK